MKKAGTRITAILTAIVCMIMTALPTAAQANAPYVSDMGGARYITAASDQDITPYLTHLSRVSCDLAVVDGAVTFYGLAAMFQNLGTKITLTLQRSTDNSNWHDMGDDYEWEQTWYANGTHSVSKTLYNLPSGYYYRVRNRACAIDSSGNELEVVVLQSRSGYKG